MLRKRPTYIWEVEMVKVGLFSGSDIQVSVDLLKKVLVLTLWKVVGRGGQFDSKGVRW